MNFQQIMQMMNNPQLRAIMSAKNPQQAIIGMIKNSPNANTEIGKNIIGMIERGDMKGLENYGKNLAQSQGVTEEQLNQLKNMTDNR